MADEPQSRAQSLQLALGQRLLHWRSRRVLDRVESGLSDSPGGEWNGESSRKIPEVIREVWACRELIFELAFQKTIARYRTFFLGPLWIVLGFAAFSFGLAFMVTVLRERVSFERFVPYVVAGLFSWNIMVGVLNEGTRSILDNRSLIHQSRAPIMIYPLVSTLRQVLLGAHTLVVVIPVLIFFPVAWSMNALWAIPGYFLLLIFCSSFAIILAIAGAYLPDLTEIMSSVLRFAFFFTPIMWMPEMRPKYASVWQYNPLYYIVESVRGPVLGTSNAAFVVGVLAVMALLAVCVASVVYARWARGARIRA